MNLLTKTEQETPPRAWGRRAEQGLDYEEVRNTPTGVGKTPRAMRRARCCRKHPHGRGEDPSRIAFRALRRETPPRAWGRPHADAGRGRGVGNTPTGVGKTLPLAGAAHRTRKHPHGRGEDPPAWLLVTPSPETPPRAWGRLPAVTDSMSTLGNTPTGVGKTSVRPASICACRKHPHGRGEDPSPSRRAWCYWETPPRAWGRRKYGYVL